MVKIDSSPGRFSSDLPDAAIYFAVFIVILIAGLVTYKFLMIMVSFFL